MKDILETLREKNPGLRLFSVLDPEFAPYGRILPAPCLPELRAAVARTPIPAEGNTYVASDPALEAAGFFQTLCGGVYGEMDIQAGYCNGRGDSLGALEYHKCSEVNFTTTGCVLLMALPEALKENRVSPADIVGFYLPPDVLMEVRPGVLHFAPCRTAPSGFNCLVVLERGVNAPLKGKPAAEGEGALLFARGKWLVAHAGSPQAAKGAFVGLTGEAIRLSC